MQHVLSQMGEIADRVIQHYQDDFRVHDVKVIEGLGAGDVLLWAPVVTGSHLIVAARAGVPNERAQEHFDAVQSLDRSPAQWYVVEVAHNGKADFRPHPAPGAMLANYAERLRDRSAVRVSELHM